MHEFSAACSIVDTVVETARANGATKVTAVNVELGEFTFLIPDQLEFNFEIAGRDTVAEGAQLVIKTRPGLLKCMDCGREGQAKMDQNLPPQIAMFSPMKCPTCGSSSTRISGGKEFIITSIEAEVETST